MVQQISYFGVCYLPGEIFFCLLITACAFHSSSRAMYADTLLIIFIAVCTALLGELLTYVLVYRSDQYKRLKSEMERKTKKLERKVGFSV